MGSQGPGGGSPMELGRGRASLSADTGAGDGKEASSASSTGGPPRQAGVYQPSLKGKTQSNPKPWASLKNPASRDSPEPVFAL